MNIQPIVINGEELMNAVSKFKNNRRKVTVKNDNYSFTIVSSGKKSKDILGFVEIFDFRGNVFANVSIKKDFDINIFCEELHSILTAEMAVLKSKIALIETLSVKM